MSPTMTDTPDPAALAASLPAFGWAKTTEAVARVLNVDNASAFRLGVMFGDAGLVEWRGQERGYSLTPLGRAVAAAIRGRGYA